MPANSRWDLIQRLRVKIVKNPGNGHLNNLNDPDRPQCVNIFGAPSSLFRVHINLPIFYTQDKYSS